MNHTKKLGIIGGMGPLADTAFLRALHLATAAKCDRDYIPVIYEGNCLRPDRSSFITKNEGSSPYLSLKNSLKRLEERGATVIVMPCNTAHFWLDKLQSAAAKSTIILDMPSTATARCAEKGLSKIGLLATEGTYKSGIYSDRLNALGIECIEPPTRSKEALAEIIRKTKAGERAVFDHIENELLSLGCEAIITGCSELSYILLNSQSQSETIYIDPISTLAVSAVLACEKEVRYIPYC